MNMLSGPELRRKLTSRKFWLALLGAVLAFVAEALGMKVPWEAIVLLASYIFGEAGVDMVRTVREHKPDA